MRIFHTFMAAALCLAHAQSASAAVTKKERPNVRKAGAEPSAICEATGVSTKRCSVHGNSAELHVNISRAHPLLVTLDEPPNFTYKDPHIAYRITDTFILFKLKKDTLPKGHNLLLRTETMTISLFFHVVEGGGDSQVHIQRSDRVEQDRIVEERVAKLEKGLAKAAARLARKQILEEIHLGGSQVGKPAGQVRARHDFLVLRATDIIRLGKERLLKISIEERKGSSYPIGQITASVEQGGAKRNLDVGVRCTRRRVRPGKTVACTLSLGAIDKRRGRALVSVKVDGADGQRSVSLDAVDIL